MKHLVFIVNPRSGVERNKQVQQAIDNILDKEVFSYEIKLTEHAGHGEDIARAAAAKNPYAVIAVGGDGSVNDVIRGLYGSQTALGIIPKGSGNGLARSLSIPVKTEAALQVINRNLTEKIDIGIANGRFFASNAGVGYDALICKKFAKSTRRGLAVYSWLITKYMWLYRDWDWDITIDGRHYKRKAFLVNVANGTQMGYDFKIAPDASWTDGLLDVVIINKFPKILGGLLGYKMFNGSLLQSRYVERIRGKEISISNPELKLMQADGDAIATSNKVEFNIIKGAIEVIVGKKSS
jgi:diacylglycerol kinase (ATP)